MVRGSRSPARVRRTRLRPLEVRQRIAVSALRALKKLHPHTQHPGRDPSTHQDSTEDPFQVLIATVLSHRTRDEMTAIASRALFAHYRSPRVLADAPLVHVRELIRPVGFYNEKAKRVKAIAKAIDEQHGGRVPDSLEALVELPGVGRKTANCVLVFGFGIPAIPVDTHVHRISNRIGLVKTEDPEDTEEELHRVVPRNWWLPLNELLVTHGREVCRPIGPKCGLCPVDGCASRRTSRSSG